MKNTLKILAIVIAMVFNQIVMPMNVVASDYEDDSEEVVFEFYDIDEEDENWEEFYEDYIDNEDEEWYDEDESEEEEDEEYEDEDEEYYEDDEDWEYEYDEEYFDDEEEDEEDYEEDEVDEEDEEWSDEDEDYEDEDDYDDEDEDWDDYDDEEEEEDNPEDDEYEYEYDYDFVPTYVEDEIASSCLNDEEQAREVAETYDFIFISYNDGVALFDTNGKDPLSFVNGDIELPSWLHFQLVVECEFEVVPVEPTDPIDEDGDGYAEGIAIGVPIDEINFGDFFEIGIDE